MPNELVKDSFKSCAITTPLDGSEDKAIHCFKPGQPCAEGKMVLSTKMEEFINEVVQNEFEDPFASDEDENEDDSNEIFIDIHADDDAVIEYGDDDVDVAQFDF